ncbi:MAG: ComEC family competence protein [Alphaproteobacteria bacterium]|nr:ComEC family competence protein [Alphaproteobacteria bacterium]
MWIPVFFGIGIAAYDLLTPSWIYNSAGLGVSVLLLVGVLFRNQLVDLAKKFQLFHPARLFRMLSTQLLKLFFYLLILPIFSQAFIFMAGLVVFTRLLRIFRWFFSPDIWQFVKPFMKRLFNLIPWRFVWKWGRNIWSVYLKRTWLGQGMSMAGSKGMSTLRQPLFWFEKSFKRVWKKFKRFQIRMLRWSLTKLRNPRIAFLRHILFLQHHKMKMTFSFKPNLKPHPLLWVALSALFISFGAMRMGWRTDALNTQTLSYPIYRKDVTGVILKNEIKGDSQRLLIQPTAIGKWETDLPGRVRITLKKIDPRLSLGDTIFVKATLLPPGKPVAPGAFDFARYAYYQGFAAVGYADKDVPVQLIEKASIPSSLFEGWREDLKTRLLVHSDTELGRFVLTILLGERYALPEESLEIFRQAGLSHLMSVSGFHLAALGFMFFFLVRFLLVLIIPLSRRMDVKKFAAGASLVFLTVFLFLSDARLPTQRAYIMTALAMVAILMNRSPFSLRLLALSALLILGISPEALFNPGFQMSFACAGALIAVYNRYTFSKTLPPWSKPISRFMKFMLLTFLTSVVAFIATAPFVLYHFHSLATVGLIANLVAIPLFSFVLLPLSVVFLLLPISSVGGILGGAYLWFKDLAVFFGELPFSTFTFSQFSVVFLIAATGALLTYLLWPFKYKRLLIAVFVAVGIGSIFVHKLPTVLINNDATVVAFEKKGTLIFATNPKKDTYTSEQWMMMYGQKGVPEKTKLCHRKHPCPIVVRGKKIMVIRRFTDVLKHLRSGCENSDYVIVPFSVTVPPSCESKLIDLSDTQKGYAFLSF